MIGFDISLTVLLISIYALADMQIKPINSQKTKDHPFEFSEHGAYRCAPRFWTVVPAQRCCTRYFCAAT